MFLWKVYKNLTAILLFFFYMNCLLKGIKRHCKSRYGTCAVVSMQNIATFLIKIEKNMMMESFVQKFYCCWCNKNQQQ